MNENLVLKGRIEIRQVRDGKVISEIHEPNTIVTLGKAQIAKSFVSGNYASSAPFGWLAIGLGSDTITAADTTLGSEYLRYGLGSVIGSTTTTTTTNDTTWWIGSFGIDASKIINEGGIFNASGLNLGSMCSRTCFTPVTALSGDRVILDWKISQP